MFVFLNFIEQEFGKYYVDLESASDKYYFININNL